jgi:hypothetical protein
MFFTDNINFGFVCFSPYKLLLEKIYDKSCEAFKNIILTWSSLCFLARSGALLDALFGF